MRQNRGLKTILLFIILSVLGGVALGAYAYRFKIWEYKLKKEQERLPAVVSQQETRNEKLGTRNNKLGVRNNEQGTSNKEQATSGGQPSTRTGTVLGQQATSSVDIEQIKNEEQLPSEINLNVPFTPQAPFAIWDVLHEDACEEASVLMVARFYRNQPIIGPADAEAEIKKLAAWEDREFGFNKDTSAELTARMLKEYYGFNVEVKYDNDVTVEVIKKEVTAGRPVIVPNFGRALGNPFFRAPGPIYHMVVIKGYTKDGKFIVNDPGTRRGADFIYKQDVVMRAINDWDDKNNKLSGRRAMIIVASVRTTN